MLAADEFKAFVSDVLAGKRHEKTWVGVVPPFVTTRIQQICRKTVSKIMVESDSVWHSYKKSSHNLYPDDIFHIVDVINTATDIVPSNYSHQNNEVLKFYKDMNNALVFIMEVRVNFGGWLVLVTCYRDKK